MTNTKGSIQIIKSEIFAIHTEIICGVSTRNGGYSPEPYNLNMSTNVNDDQANVMLNRKRYFGELNISLNQLAIPGQIHSDVVNRVTKPGTYDACDALLTNIPNIFLVVTVANCLPIFLYDPQTKSVAAVHVGWRGSESRILDKTINKMSASFGTKANDLFVFIGPAAGLCCYEVGNEVAE